MNALNVAFVTDPLMPDRLNFRYARVSGDVLFLSTTAEPKLVLGKSDWT